MVIQLKHIKRFILSTFIIFLPFSQALTINLFFPLKVSEIALFMFLAYTLVKLILEKDIWFKSDNGTYIILVFMGVALASTLFNIVKTYPYELNVAYVRTSKTVDSVLKFIYLIFAFVGMRMTILAVKTYGQHTVLKWLFWGAFAASCYAWYLMLSSSFHIPYLLLPGMDNPPQRLNLSWGNIVRCGTFKEGNYMGLFLFICGILARYDNRNKLGNFFFATIITTFSTVCIFCVVIYFVFNSLYSKNKAKTIVSLAAIVLIFSALLAGSADFRTIVVNKLFGTEETVANQNDLVSKLDRLNTTTIGLQLFAANPILGVGMANFGLHYEHYNTIPLLGEGDYKRIPNNVYIELLSETGLVSILLFFAFIYIVVRYTKQLKNKQLSTGLIISFVYLIAFPTYTMLVLWFFWGFLIGKNKYLLQGATS